MNTHVISMTDDERKQREVEDMAQTGYNFMSAITNHYGAEKGMQLWENIMAELPEVKGKIFMDMLAGNAGNYGKIQLIRSTNGYGTTNRVNAIKAVREASHMGLKEAKDLVDAVDGYPQGSGVTPSPQSFELMKDIDRNHILRLLRAAGYEAR